MLLVDFSKNVWQFQAGAMLRLLYSIPFFFIHHSQLANPHGNVGGVQLGPLTKHKNENNWNKIIPVYWHWSPSTRNLVEVPIYFISLSLFHILFHWSNSIFVVSCLNQCKPWLAAGCLKLEWKCVFSQRWLLYSWKAASRRCGVHFPCSHHSG